MFSGMRMRATTLAVAAAIGTTIAAGPALADPTPVPASTQSAIGLDWTAIGAHAAAAGDSAGAAAAGWVLDGQRGVTPTAADRLTVEHAVLAAVAYDDDTTGTTTEGATGEGTTGTATPDTSTGSSSTGSSDLGSDFIQDALKQFFADFDWSVITIPLLSIALQGQGIPAVIATPLAQLIWTVIEATFPSATK